VAVQEIDLNYRFLSFPAGTTRFQDMLPKFSKCAAYGQEENIYVYLPAFLGGRSRPPAMRRKASMNIE
jgi:hypothetical protein